MDVHTGPQGLALYGRAISTKRWGTPKEFAKRCADHGLRWFALAAIWQELKNGRIKTGRMNSVENVRRYADALWDAGVTPWVWGYPWMGEEEKFADMMTEYATYGKVLLDPELGSNPKRASKGIGKLNANAHAEQLVSMFRERLRGDDWLGLSTFGNGWRIGWFPLLAFTQALVKDFGDRTFIGGQTYTDDGVIDSSIADMQTVIEKAGGVVGRHGRPNAHTCWVVPNYGTYIWESPAGKRGKRTRGAKAKSKTAQELSAHLYEFVNEREPVYAMIGWAENFMTRPLWDELHRFSDLMKRGVCEL